MTVNLSIIDNPSRNDWDKLLKRPALDSSYLEQAIAEIFTSVKSKGDKALLDFTKQFDGVDLESLEVPLKAISASESMVNSRLKNAIHVAAENIAKFHNTQRWLSAPVETVPGVKCWQKLVPISRVGLYIPGGTAPLISTVLMLAVPAQLAGCREIIICTPPAQDKTVNPAILYAAKISGVNNIYTLGGAQAIAAMAFGTETIMPVNKIFGPGNQYVTAAKQMVQKLGVAIDIPAGPSEVLVMADHTAIPSFIASDLLSQAEHGSDSQVVLVTTDINIATNTLKALNEQVKFLPRQKHIYKSLESSKIIVLNSIDSILDLVNEYAPEHLIIAMNDAEILAERITNAGSVFLGNYCPESAGDYASGTNHTLPTNGFAKAYSGVNLDSFVKKITFQHITPEGIMNLGDTIIEIAEAEHLHAHKNAVQIRIDEITKNK